MRLRLALSVLVVVLLAPAAHGEEGLAGWRDRETLRAALARALAAAQHSCGARFERLPRLRITTAEEMAEILEDEMGPLVARLEPTLDEEGAQSFIRAMAASLVGKYEPATRTIHILPDNAANLAALHGEEAMTSLDVLDVLLAHEAVHALDFERFPGLDRERVGRETADGVQAAGAVIEGHAQFHARAIAERWEKREAFDLLTRLIVEVPPTDDPTAQMISEVVAADLAFAYVQGLRFVGAVHEARGREGVEAALRDPPASTRLIENPGLWLEPEADTLAFAPGPVLRPFREALPEGWAVQEVVLKRAQIRPAIGVLDEARVDAVLARYVEGVAVVGRSPDGAGQLVAALMAFETPRAASETVVALREVHEKKDELMTSGAVRIAASEYDDGTGPDGELPGFVVRKRVETLAGSQRVIVHTTPSGRHVIEAVFVGEGVAPAAQARVLGEAVATLRGTSRAPAGQPSPEDEPAAAPAGAR